MGDRYLAANGFESPQTDQPRDPDRPDDLHAPVDAERDFGAHGRFDDRARSSSSQVWVRRHGRLVGLAAVGLAGLAMAAWRRA